MGASLTRRRILRLESTPAEAAMWACLRSRQLAGFKFRRQHPLGPYILDFYCPAHLLAIELDGGQHFEREALAYDARRSAYLRRQGIRTLRFANNVALGEKAAVLEAIAIALGAGGDAAAISMRMAATRRGPSP